MANALFTKFKEALLNADVDVIADNIKVVLVDHGTDTPNVSTDQFLSDISAGARIGTSGNLANKTYTGGVFDADDITISSVSGATVESVVVYQDTGNAATSRLIAYFDSATGLTLTPSGSDVIVQWNASGIFAL